MVKRISIAIALIMSFVVTYCSVPRYVQASKASIPSKAMPRPTIMPKPSIIEPEKELPVSTAKEIPAAKEEAPVIQEETAEAATPEKEEATSEKDEAVATEKEEEAPEQLEAVLAKEPEEKPAAVKETPKIDVMDIDIASDSRVAVATLLNTLLADEYIHAVRAQNFHWNIRNTMNFNDLHLFFGKIYGEISCIIDIIAERIRALGGRPYGTLTEFVKNARLKEEDGAVLADKEMIKKLLDDSETIIRTLRANIQKMAQLNDMGTENILSDLITKHEKMAWMLRSYLK